MINITFRPDKTKIRKDGKVQLYIHFTLEGKRTKVTIPLRVEASYWSQTKQKATQKASQGTVINTELSKYRQIAEKTYKTGMQLSEFRKLFVVAMGGNKNDDTFFLHNYIGKFQETHINNYSNEYLRSFNSIKTTIKQFDEKLRIDRVTYNDLSQFAAYLASERGLVDSTVNKQITRLKTVLKYAKADGVQIDEKAFNFSYKAAPTETIAFSESDIEKLKSAKFDREDLGRQRDVILFAIETGQRQSDRGLLSKDDIKKDGKGRYYLEFIMVKTKIQCTIPLSELALQILNKYDFNLPILSQQATSRSWKLVCSFCGIRESVTQVQFINGKRIAKSLPKYKLVSTHTARRTFATLVYNRTKNIKLVSKLLGHASIETTSKYLKIDDDELFEMFGE